MTRAALLDFIRAHRMVVQASVSPEGAPQAAVVGAVVTDQFDLFFDTIDATRKVRNLRNDARISFVIGGLALGEEKTVQYEGIADEPHGSELEALKELYFKQFPDGRERQKWPGLVYVRARPIWVRVSDFGRRPPFVVELTAEQLDRLT